MTTTAIEAPSGAFMFPDVGDTPPRTVTSKMGCTASFAGSIELLIGPMFSGKTTAMISKIRQASFAQKKCYLIKYARDTRYTDENVIITHDGMQITSTAEDATAAEIKVVTTGKLLDLPLSEIVTFDYVGLDEGQMYPDLIDFCEVLATEGLHIIISALDGDYKRRPFAQVCSLIPLCEKVHKHHGVCMSCRARDSSFTERITGGTATIQIGGRESYRSVCRDCYHNYDLENSV